MRAIILAAGRGERMRPLTDLTPKPLLPVRGKPLIVWHIEALAAGGVRDIVINTAWLAEQFPALLGDGARFGVRLHFINEALDHGGALETGGGIRNALALLCADGDAAFWVASADVFMPDFRCDAARATQFAESALDAQLWLVANRPHHPGGDFGIDAQGLALGEEACLAEPSLPRYTWSCVGLFKAQMFAGLPLGRAERLRPILEASIKRRALAAEFFGGSWTDVGTPDRWAFLQG
jgi:MurNAc alpha-1-phosphate uridylyltransferase